MKRLLITLMTVIMLVSSVAFVSACDTSKVLTNYVLTEHRTLVEDDFELPMTIGGKSVTWTSNDTDYVAIEKGENAYIAKVSLGDTTKNVELTVTCGKEEKTFEVTVVALDVYYISGKYNFAQANQTVYEDFDLDTSYTVAGKTATITWTSGNTELLKINEAGNRCIVTETSLNTTVMLSAKFTYNDQTTTVPYRVTVSFQRDHLEEVDYWYSNTGVSITMSGYLVAVAEVYTDTNKNVSLYMVDDDFCAGYYLFRVGVSADDAALLEPGVHVTATGTKNTNYNGLIETSQNTGTLVVDKDGSGNVIKMSEEDAAKQVYALDNDLLADVPAVIYNQSRLVSLNKWTVKEVKTTPDGSSSTETMFILEKGGVQVSVIATKYLAGVYAKSADDAVWSAIIAKLGNIQAGSVVSVTGVLGYYNGNTIAPLKADDITIETGDATAAPEMCANVKAAIEAVNNAFTTEVTVDTTFNLPTSSNGVEITHKLLHSSEAVSIDETGKVTVKVGDEDNAYIQVTYTVKDGESVVYTTSTFHTIHSVELTPARKVSAALDKVEASMNITKAGEYDLDAKSSLFEEVTFAWEVSENDVAEIKEGKLVIAALPTADTTVTLKVTATCGDADDYKEITVSIKAATIPMAAGTYLKLYQAKLEKTLYFTGELNSSNFGVTTEKAGEAAKFVISEVEDGGYTIKFGDNYLELNSSNRLTYVTEPTGAWKYDTELEVYTWTIGETDYYLGTYGTFNTISASSTYYISGDKAADVGVSQFPASYEQIVETGTFKLAIQQNNLNQKIYFTGTMSGSYGATTTNFADAADVVVAKVGDGYTFKAGDNYIEVHKVVSGEKTYYNFVLVEESTGTWKFNFDVNTFTWDIEGDEYYIGTYNNFNTISPSLIKYMSTSFPAYFERLDA